MRKLIIAANWKMNMGPQETADFIDSFSQKVADTKGVDIVLSPPMVSLATASTKLAGSSIGLSGQNVSENDNGAFTGETSTLMLKELFVQYVIIGHSERRSIYSETDAIINAKIKKAREANLKPIFCIGETLEQREGGQLESVLRTQITEGLVGVSVEDLAETVIAYEPVWAIGTGVTASAQQAQDAHAFCRSVIAELYGKEAADKIRIQYGGSVKPANSAELLGQEDIDGALVGGASLDPQVFADLIHNALS